MYKKVNNKGQSIIEIVIALGIFVLMAAALSSLLLGGFQLLNRSQEYLSAQIFAQEGQEAVKSISKRAWNEIIFSESDVEIFENKWIFSGEGTNKVSGNFTRQISFFPAYRDNDNKITDISNPDNYLDPMTIEYLIAISWQNERGVVDTLELGGLLTNREAYWWTQSDWAGGSGEQVWLFNNKYFSSNNISVITPGEISLSFVGTSTMAMSGDLISSAFDTEKESSFSAIFWEESIPETCTTCKTKLQIKTAPDNLGAPGIWSSTWSGPEGEDGDETDYYLLDSGELINMDHNNDQWIRYKIIIEGNGDESPVVGNIKIYYQ